jgi:hypothetical protein
MTCTDTYNVPFIIITTTYCHQLSYSRKEEISTQED